MITDRLNEDLKLAMKAKEEMKVSILRMFLAAAKNKRIELRRDLNEDEVLSVLRTLVKQYRDAIDDFRKGNRQDLMDKTEAEVKILETYLPQGLSEEEVRKVVEQKVKELGEVGPKDFGKVMGLVMKELGNRTTGDLVSKIVRELLG